MSINSRPNEIATASGKPPWIEVVERQVKNLHYGSILITVHDSKVVQIETTEKIRIDRDERPPSIKKVELGV